MSDFVLQTRTLDHIPEWIPKKESHQREITTQTDLEDDGLSRVQIDLDDARNLNAHILEQLEHANQGKTYL